jgi:N-acetylglutamate synthase-like GNAT family acetyltransferase
MNPPKLRVRRATTDDLPSLKPLWKSLSLPADDLEKRLTEFQLVETDDGQLLGAIGIQILRQSARLHSEAYPDFDLAGQVRPLFWERIRTLAANHGVFRLWTQHDSPDWILSGFQPANPDALARLPDEWKPLEGQWFTCQLKDEKTIAAAFEKEFAQLTVLEKQAHQRLTDQARLLKTIITVIGFAIGIFCFGLAGYLLFRYLSISR